jgi:ABC-2 type transport system permease protein
MRTILYILQKEFRQIFRDKAMLPIIFIIPMVQLLILSFTATFEIKNTNIAIIDRDKSVESRNLIRKFEGSPFFTLNDYFDSYDQGVEALKNGQVHQLLIIQPEFSKNLEREGDAHVMIITDAINGSAASIMNAYSYGILLDYNKEIVIEHYPQLQLIDPIRISLSNWYNPQLNYITYMVPGILVLLVTIIGMFLSGMNIVKEKELGTIEQINVTPIKKYQFIIGKLMPFWLIALFEFGFGLTLARFIFGVPMLGNLGLQFGSAAVYLLVVLGMGLFISTFTDTMQQAMFLSWFFMVIFILMSGLFTPIESMPDWAQTLNKINPIAYFIQINRMIMLKGSGFSDFSRLFYAMLAYAIGMISLSVWRYRKVA